MDTAITLLLAALAWIGKFILILLGITVALGFVLMIVIVLKYDPGAVTIPEDEAEEQAKAIAEAKRRREERENAQKVRRELQRRKVSQGSHGAQVVE